MISLLSLFLDLGNYNLIRRESLFLSLFSVISIMFVKRDKKYYYKIFFLGIIYDLLFTEYYFLNGFIFLILGFIVNNFYNKIDFGIINNMFLGLILVIIYQLILYVVLNVTEINKISRNEFLFIIKHYIILNILYVLLISIIKKVKLKI